MICKFANGWFSGPKSSFAGTHSLHKDLNTNLLVCSDAALIGGSITHGWAPQRPIAIGDDKHCYCILSHIKRPWHSQVGTDQKTLSFHGCIVDTEILSFRFRTVNFIHHQSKAVFFPECSQFCLGRPHCRLPWFTLFAVLGSKTIFFKRPSSLVLSTCPGIFPIR